MSAQSEIDSELIMNQLGILKQPNEGINRPTAISVICIVGFIGAGLSVPMIFSEIARQIGPWFSPYAGFATVANLICMIGLWRTRKWGLHAYTVLVLVNQIVLIAQGEWNLMVLLVQSIVIFIALYHLEPRTRPTYLHIATYLKKQAWAIIVAYMVGIHNFYKGEEKTPEDIVFKIEDIEEQEDSAPKD